MDSTGEEYVILTKPEVFVFRVPPRPATGHKAADWRDKQVLCGSLEVVTKGTLAIVKLKKQTGELFAACPVRDEASIEPVTDSGRYFCLRVENARGQRAFIGIGFSERGDAFDFKTGLADAEKSAKGDTSRAELDAELSKVGAIGALSDGVGKIKLNVKGVKVSKKSKKKKTSSSRSGGGLLAPPPASARVVGGGAGGGGMAAAALLTGSSDPAGEDDLLGLGGFSAPAPAPAPAPEPAAAAPDDWVAF